MTQLLSVAIVEIEKDSYDNLDIFVWHQDGLTLAQADACGNTHEVGKNTYIELDGMLVYLDQFRYWLMEPLFDSLSADQKMGLRRSELGKARPDLCCLF